jgi:hypothetical protein
MSTNDNINNSIVRITTEERIKIKVKYLDWLYAKSRERKKQNKGLLLDTPRNRSCHKRHRWRKGSKRAFPEGTR